jgi:hypothetical protein
VVGVGLEDSIARVAERQVDAGDPLHAT